MLKRALKKLTKAELEEIATIVVKGSVDDLKALLKDGSTSIIKAMVAGVALRAIKNGDSSAFNTLLDRMIGRVPAKDSIHFSGDGSVAAPTVVVNIPSNGREVKKPDASGK